MQNTVNKLLSVSGCGMYIFGWRVCVCERLTNKWYQPVPQREAKIHERKKKRFRSIQRSGGGLIFCIGRRLPKTFNLKMTKLWVQDDSIAFGAYSFCLYNSWICKSKWKTIRMLPKMENASAWCYDTYLNNCMSGWSIRNRARDYVFLFLCRRQHLTIKYPLTTNRNQTGDLQIVSQYQTV